MTRIVNLNRARKSRALIAARKAADENAVKFGRSRADRTRLEAEARKLRAALEGHKRET